MYKAWGSIRIRIWIGIKMESRIRKWIGTKTMPIDNIDGLSRSIASQSLGIDSLTRDGAVLRIRVGSGFNRVPGSGYEFVIRIWIQEGKNDPQK
jgi:hypothetical protein